VSSRCQAVAAHAAVVRGFVSALSVRGQADNDIAGADMGVVDDVCSFHSTGDGAVNDDGPDKVAHVGCFTTGAVYTDTHVS